MIDWSFFLFDLFFLCMLHKCRIPLVHRPQSICLASGLTAPMRSVFAVTREWATGISLAALWPSQLMNQVKYTLSDSWWLLTAQSWKYCMFKSAECRKSNLFLTSGESFSFLWHYEKGSAEYKKLNLKFLVSRSLRQSSNATKYINTFNSKEKKMVKICKHVRWFSTSL